MDIENFGKGCYPDTPDDRDYIIEDILGAPTEFDWDKGFDVEEVIDHKTKIESQGKSSSCVGQAWSYYAQVLEIIETGKFTDLSAKDIYSRIFYEGGGATLRDGAKLVKNRGVAMELSNPSYMDGKPPTEAFMRELVNGLEEEAKKFSAKDFARMTHNSIDFMAGYIRDHHGLVSGVLGDNEGWRVSDGIVKPPVNKDWGHGLYFGKAKLINGVKKVGACNSWSENWGDKGWAWIGADYFGSLFNLWTLIDNPNNIKKMKLVIDGNKDQYLVDEASKFGVSIADEEMLNEITNHLAKLGQPVKEPVLTDMISYYIVHGASARKIKEFFNI